MIGGVLCGTPFNHIHSKYGGMYNSYEFRCGTGVSAVYGSFLCPSRLSSIVRVRCIDRIWGIGDMVGFEPFCRKWTGDRKREWYLSQIG